MAQWMREYFDFSVMLGKPTVVFLDNWLDIDKLKQEMEQFNIKNSLVYHSYSKDYDAFFGNRYLIEEINGQTNLYPCWTLLPFDISPINSPQELYEEFKRYNIRSVRLFPEYHNFLLEGEIFSILRSHPNLRLVLVELTYHNSRNLFPLLKDYPNVSIELSGYIPFLGIEGIYKRFGAERMFFGSDLPLKSPGATIFYIDSHVPINDEKTLKIVEYFENTPLIYLIHTWGTSMTYQLTQLAKKFPEVKFIMGHTGGDVWFDCLEIVKPYSNIYVEPCSSYADRDKLRLSIDTVGLERVLFGSDFTLINPAFVIGMVEGGNLTKKEKNAVYFENAIKLLKGGNDA